MFFCFVSFLFLSHSSEIELYWEKLEKTSLHINEIQRTEVSTEWGSSFLACGSPGVHMPYYVLLG